jgi:hypothetical protein
MRQIRKKGLLAILAALAITAFGGLAVARAHDKSHTVASDVTLGTDAAEEAIVEADDFQSGELGQANQADDGQQGQSGDQAQSGQVDDGQQGQSGDQGQSGQADDGQQGQSGDQGQSGQADDGPSNQSGDQGSSNGNQGQ